MTDLEFIRPNKRAVMVTRRKDGRLQTSVVTAVYDPAGKVWVWTRYGSAKMYNLTRDRRVALCVVGEQWSQWIHVDGEGEVLHQPEVLPLLDDYYRFRELKEHPNWAEWRQRVLDERRVLLRITPTGVLNPPRP